MISVTLEWPVAEQQVVRQTLTLGKAACDDLRPVFERYRGVLRTRHRQTMDAMRDPLTGLPWTPLLPKYAASKPPGTQNRILYRSGRLRKALTVFQAPWSIYQATPKSMVWGVDSPSIYPLVHQTTLRSRKDGQPLRRGYMGLKLPDDLNTLARYIRTHIIGQIAKGGAKGGQ